MGRKRKPQTFSDELREAIDASGLSRYRICMKIGLAQSCLSRFMAGQMNLTTATLDRIAELIDLHVTTGGKA
jgi:plasmid maintenance system antidote protein VapI